MLQSLGGYWEVSPALAEALDTNVQNLNYMISYICKTLTNITGKPEDHPNITKVAASLLVLATLEKKFESKAHAWQLLGQKTRRWICGEMQMNEEQLEEGLEAARNECDLFEEKRRD